MSTTDTAEVLKAARACFDGIVLSALAYGALVMLCVQIAQVLLHRPKRNITFYLIIVYTSVVFAITTAGFYGKFNFAEMTYISNRMYPGGPKAYASTNADHWSSLLSKVCSTVMSWFADLLMFYRVYALCGRRMWHLLIPIVIYLARIAVSIPVLMSAIRPSHPVANTKNFNIAQCAAYLALNFWMSTVIWIRLYAMKRKTERVLGRLQATLYNSYTTLFVESGAFFTLWSMVHLILKLTNNWAQDAFWQPYTYVVAITRMLVVLRIAQERAWTREIVDAASTGMLEWGVASTGSAEYNIDPHHQARGEKGGIEMGDEASIQEY